VHHRIALLGARSDLSARNALVSSATYLLPLFSFRTSISNNVGKRAESVRDIVLPQVKAAMEKGFCAMTTDACTERHSQEKFFTLTSQFLDSDKEGKWVLNSKVIFTNLFKKHGTYTSSDVGDHILKHCEDRKLPQNLIKQIPFTVDGGADITKALNDLEIKRFYCFAHFLNVCLTNSFELKVYQLDLYTLEAKSLLTDIMEVVETVKKKPVGRDLVSELPKGRTRGPFPSKVPLLRAFYKNYNKVIFFHFIHLRYLLPIPSPKSVFVLFFLD
jgi:hypothetical protein